MELILIGFAGIIKWRIKMCTKYWWYIEPNQKISSVMFKNYKLTNPTPGPVQIIWKGSKQFLRNLIECDAITFYIRIIKPLNKSETVTSQMHIWFIRHYTISNEIRNLIWFYKDENIYKHWKIRFFWGQSININDHLYEAIYHKKLYITLITNL